jgi:hypothetical protein
MTRNDELADRSELNELAFRYASAVDGRDRESFLAVFHPEGRLATFAPDAETPFSVQTGHGELAWIPVAMTERFDATMHVMTNHLIEISGDEATGSVYCSARHLITNLMGGMDLVVLIRYEDRYRRDGGRWRILDREIHFLWTETYATLTAEQSVMA